MRALLSNPIVAISPNLSKFALCLTSMAKGGYGVSFTSRCVLFSMFFGVFTEYSMDRRIKLLENLQRSR